MAKIEAVAAASTQLRIRRLWRWCCCHPLFLSHSLSQTHTCTLSLSLSFGILVKNGPRLKKYRRSDNKDKKVTLGLFDNFFRSWNIREEKKITFGKRFLRPKWKNLAMARFRKTKQMSLLTLGCFEMKWRNASDSENAKFSFSHRDFFFRSLKKSFGEIGRLFFWKVLAQNNHRFNTN